MAQTNGADVLIVGGGIIGVLTAIALADRGVTSTILERGEPLQESSWAGAGILSPIYPWRYPDGLSHLVNRSLSLYPELMDDLAQTSGIDPEFRTTGLMIPVYDPSEWQVLEQALPWSQRFGWDARRLSAEEARRIEPSLADSVLGAVDWPQVGQIRNPRLTQAVRRTAEARGVNILSHCEVTGIRAVTGGICLQTSQGEMQAGRVLLSAGSWSGELARQTGVRLPIQPVKGQILLLKTEPGTLRRIIKHEQAYLVPRKDGHILVGATMEMAGFDRRTTLSALHFLSGALMEMAPALARAEVVKHWMGFRPGTPDGLPYLGAVEQLPGLFVAAGHYRNGVVLAPATAEAMACLLTDSAPPVALDDFAVTRPVVTGSELGFPEAALSA